MSLPSLVHVHVHAMWAQVHRPCGTGGASIRESTGTTCTSASTTCIGGRCTCMGCNAGLGVNR